jgi:CheY-like chemotaxis protein
MSSEPMPRAACVVLVDDNATTRFLQRRLLGRMQGVEHVREAGSVEEALACLTQL